MCVILEKLPGKSIPYEHLLAGAHRNSDGYGVAVVDRGKLEIVRGLSNDFKKGADSAQKLLEQCKDHLAYVHFRYRTQGNVDIENVHPFKVYKSQGTEVVFMHNGTVPGFYTGSEGISDSRALCERILAPLAKRTAALLGEENICSDPLMAEILKQYAGGTYNKFVLLDNHGNNMVINRATGVPQDYGWASNSYSLDPKPIQKYIIGDGANLVSKTTQVTLPMLPKPQNVTPDNVTSLKDKIEKGKKDNKPSPRAYHPSIRQTVEDLTGFSLKDLCHLDAEQVRTMVRDQPDLSAVLILDLLSMVYDEEFRAVKVG